MTNAGRTILRGVSYIALHLLMQLVWLAVFVAAVIIWVELGLPFSLMHLLLLGLPLILGVNAMARMIRRRRSHA